MTRVEANALYTSVLSDGDTEALRQLCLHDLFFLLTVGCKRQDMNRDWLYARCREVEQSPDGHLDLWAREHYKSTIITFGYSIQRILRQSEETDPVTIGIFSHTRPIAKAFLKQIKTELETNTFLQDLFPDVLYKNPEKESPSWGLDNGITTKRATNPKENTVEAWGLVDGSPIGKHFTDLVYDDVVTAESVSTPDQIAKTTEAWGMSLSLGAVGGRTRTIGTRYHFNDTYKVILDREAALPRIYPATHDGTVDGTPVLMPAAELVKRRKSGPYVYACQYLQNPIADEAQGFKEEWLEYYEADLDPRGMNIYGLVDAANAKKKNNDYTVQLVVGLAPDNNYYILHAVRDRMNLTERTNSLFSLARRFRLMNVGYEQYGMMADVEHIKYVQAQINYRFPLVALGGQMPKVDRIRRLIPIFEQRRVLIPRRLLFRSTDGKTHDFIQEFKDDEYIPFPVGVHDDMMDCLARILEPELGAVFPQLKQRDGYNRIVTGRVADSYEVLPGMAHTGAR
ncbi:MAG: hypothetical protein WCS70_06795 [Verrucomicrobiota bacterium]